MKYWIGKIGTDKEGQYGCMDDGGFVPNSENLSKQQYDDRVLENEMTALIKEDSDFEKLIKWAKKEGHI